MNNKYKYFIRLPKSVEADDRYERYCMVFIGEDFCACEDFPHGDEVVLLALRTYNECQRYLNFN